MSAVAGGEEHLASQMTLHARHNPKVYELALGESGKKTLSAAEFASLAARGTGSLWKAQRRYLQARGIDVASELAIREDLQRSDHQYETGKITAPHHNKKKYPNKVT